MQNINFIQTLHTNIQAQHQSVCLTQVHSPSDALGPLASGLAGVSSEADTDSAKLLPVKHQAE